MGLLKAMRALHLPEPQIAGIKETLEHHGGEIEIGGRVSGPQRVFSVSDLIAAGFEEVNAK